MRVVSLLPSATEMLCRIGGGSLLVGRSHECDWPPEARRLPVLTTARTEFVSSAQVDAGVSAALASGLALYDLDVELLGRLRPDLILTQDLCRVCSIDLACVRSVAESLPTRARVVSLDALTVEGILDDVLAVGRAVGLDDNAAAAVIELRQRLYAAGDFVNPYGEGPVVAFLEWTDPPFVAGHWTAQLVERAGARHPLNPTVPSAGAGAAAGPIGSTARTAAASRRVSHDELGAARPDVLVVCPCGLDLARARAEFAALAGAPWFDDLPAVRRARSGITPAVAIVDGNQYFNRPGPRLVDAFEWLVGYLNDRPELIPMGFAWEAWTG
ncbi:MAG: ABC transporter substrate-binding protein [Phycisphaerae bacterium]|nr:ABC transporter substrate-binding protein [Phycisphaerae bacterium]